VHTPRWVVGMVALAATTAVLIAPSQASAAPLPPDEDPFYVYDGSQGPIADVAPGTVLKTRTGSETFDLIPQPVTWTQLLYRTRTQLGEPTVTVTTVLQPPLPLPPSPRVVSYQSFYDSLTTRCQPSYTLNGGPENSLYGSEKHFYESLLLQGYTVISSDFESQDPTFGTGPIYGYQTLDGIRAAFNSDDVSLPTDTKVGLAGYSGGAIATEWATELAPTYAPDVDSRLVGSAMGGVFVHPLHNLHYVDGSDGGWDDVMPLALIGIARAFDLDLTPYLSDWAKAEFPIIDRDCIGEHSYTNLTFAKMVKPQYAEPETIKPFVDTANKLIMGNNSTPSVPLFIREGTDGPSEGTEPHPVYGEGDGVMLVKDVRALVHKYCEADVAIDYLEVPLGHGNTGAETLVDMIDWMQLRFAGVPAAENTCAVVSGLPRNSLAPTPLKVKATCQGQPATIFGTSAADLLVGTEGDDIIAGLGGNDTIRGGGGNDVVCGDAGSDQMYGGDGNDSLAGGGGPDRFSGGNGTDTVTYANRGAVKVSIDGRANDGNSGDGASATARDYVSSTVENLIGSDNNDTLKGNSVANRLTGGLGADGLYGLGGTDTLIAKDGVKDTTLDGGTGADTGTFDKVDPPRISVP